MHVVDVADGSLGEVEAEHRANAIEGPVATGLREGGANAFLELGADGLEAVPALGLFQFPQLGHTGGEGERIAGKGAGLVNGAVGSELPTFSFQLKVLTDSISFACGVCSRQIL